MLLQQYGDFHDGRYQQIPYNYRPDLPGYHACYKPGEQLVYNEDRAKGNINTDKGVR